MLLLVIMQWCSISIHRHTRNASQIYSPAQIDCQNALDSFHRMNQNFSSAAVMHDISGLERARQEASRAEAGLTAARASLRRPNIEQTQIELLIRQIAAHASREDSTFTSLAMTSDGESKQGEILRMAREYKEIEMALDSLNSALTNDYRRELSLIDRLQVEQEALVAVVLFGALAGFMLNLRQMLAAHDRERTTEIRRIADEEVERERSMLRALMDNTPNFIYIKDTEHRYLVANQHLAQVVGAESPDAMLGKTDYDYYPKEIADQTYREESEVMGTGQSLLHREVRSVDRDGNQTLILANKVPLRDLHGATIGIAGVGIDITERKQMELALREAEGSYRSIFDKAVVGIFQCTPEGLLLAVNPSMATAFGYDSPEEMIAEVRDISSHFFVNPKREIEFMLVMDRVGGVKSFECDVYCKDGRAMPVSLSIRAIRQEGTVVRYEGMCEDCTERNQLRAQVLHAQKLESVGQLAAGIAHEINTPTQFVGDNVHFLDDAFRDLASLLSAYRAVVQSEHSPREASAERAALDEALRKVDVEFLMSEAPRAIEQTLDGVSRVADLVGAMKEFSHPGSKEAVLADLNRALESTIVVSRNEWKYDAEVETDFDPELPRVPCLAGELNQVFLNLIVNAAHTIGEANRARGRAKGTIRIQTRAMTSGVEVRFTDNGMGIAQKVRARIFDPFFTTKEIGKGTGQGLAIARSVIVDKHRGKIDFETVEGQGTTFIVFLPLQHVNASEPQG